MAAPMKTGLPPDCELSAGYIVQLLALDANGAQVANVQLSEVSFFVTDLNANVGDTTSGAPEPLLVPTAELV